MKIGDWIVTTKDLTEFDGIEQKFPKGTKGEILSFNSNAGVFLVMLGRGDLAIVKEDEIELGD